MPQRSPNREIAFLVNDVARMLRTYANHRAATLGMTRAQWAVLVRLERAEGLKQGELAELLDLQPITLTRLVDRMCDGGLIERRPDPSDRRAKRLFLTPAARPLLERMHVLGETLMAEVLKGIDAKTVGGMLEHLDLMKENLKQAIHNKPGEGDRGVRYG